jgi:radical SAM enzyme (TIGR01210 family)
MCSSSTQLHTLVPPQSFKKSCLSAAGLGNRQTRAFFPPRLGVSLLLLNAYPTQPSERSRWIVEQRPARHTVDPQRPSAFLVEEERAASGELVKVATVFLTNRECPWRCLMCDLWKNTLTESVPAGAIPAQIDHALARLPPARQIKLYNAGSFFDPRAIPTEDHSAIAERVRRFEGVIVECHPALINEPLRRFRDLLRPTTKLEVAMGLETAHPEVLEKLNKQMTLGQFAQSAEFLRSQEVSLRVFVLVQPPFLYEAEALYWAQRSVDFAFDSGAGVVSLIPTRLGNGALEALAARGEFSPPKLSTLEAAAAYGVGLRRGRVFADLWDLERFSGCAECFDARRERLRQMNHTQVLSARVACPRCLSA